MHVSEARRAANIANSAKAKGPITERGKRQSRRNSLKHDLTGEGIVLPEADQAEVDRRAEALGADMRPRSALGSILLRKVAVNSVRAERAGELENAMLDMMVRDAVEVFDRDRADHAEALFGALNDNPRSYTRQLRRMPEGVDLMLAAWRTLRDDLARVGRNAWGISHLGRAACLTGVRVEQGYTTRFGDLSNALWGDFDGLGDHEGGDLDDQGRRDWARARLGELVEAEIASLEAHRKTLDLKRIASNRREAPARARFDDSAEGARLKRYEATRIAPCTRR